MTDRWEALAWDSDFFGFSIGKVDLDGLDPEKVAVVEEEARAAGVVCLYGSADPADRSLNYRVQEMGWRFVDAATMFSLRKSEPPIPRPEGIQFRLGTLEDLPAMDDVVAKLADWSRFAVDPRFGAEAALRLQRAWIRRAAAPDADGYSLVVAEGDDGIVAFISRADEPFPVVDTVGTTARSSGAARFLIEDARAWAGAGDLLGGPIAARNVHALRYVSHCGYRVHWVRYLYHRWLDEPSGAGS